MSTTISPVQEMPREQTELIKRTVAKGATDDELALFLYQAKRTGLDPLSRQIHFIKRWDAAQGREVGTVQTGIDGLRLIASRTGRYRPDEEAARFTITEKGQLLSAKARVYMMAGGKWFPVEAEAYYDEYLQTRKDKQTGEILATAMWKRMPRLMLAKCAEALALRKAFPAELSGIYAAEEFGEAVTVSESVPTNVNAETGEITETATVQETAADTPPPESRKNAIGRLNKAFVGSGLDKNALRDKARQMFGRSAIAGVADLSDTEISQLADEVESLLAATKGVAS